MTTTTENYKLISTKGTREFFGTQDDAIKAAVAMEADLQPAFGVTVDLDGETIAEIRDGVDTYADEAREEEDFDRRVEETLDARARADMDDLNTEIAKDLGVA